MRYTQRTAQPDDLVTMQQAASHLLLIPHQVRWAVNADRITRYVPDGKPNDGTAANTLVSLAEVARYFGFAAGKTV